MKKLIEKLLLSIGLVLVSIITLFVTNDLKVYALSPNYNGTGNEVYYFADSKPVLSDNDFNNYFGNSGYSIVYDIPYYVDDVTLSDMYNNGYFAGFAQDTIVVFELKTRVIDGNLLNMIFSDMQQQGCYIIFVSGFSDSQYNTDIHPYVDCYLETLPHITFEEYVHMSVIDIISRHNNSSDPSSPIVILVDSRYCYINDWQNSRYIQLMLDELCVHLGLYSTPGDYYGIMNELYYNGLVYFLVNTSFENYEVIKGFQGYNVRDINDLNYFITDVLLVSCSLDNYYAMGIWSLIPDFYTLLNDFWQNIGYPIPTYVWVIDEFNQTPGGLPVITDYDLAILNGYEFDHDYAILDDLIYALSNAMNR